MPGCAGRRVCEGRWSRVRRDETLGDPWGDRAGTGGDTWALSSWGRLGPCTSVPEFSVVALWLSSVWSPSPLEGSMRFSVSLSTRGAQSPLFTPLPFPPGCPLFCFSLLPGVAMVLLQGRGDPAVTSRSNLAAASTPEKGPCGQLAPSLWSVGNDRRLFRGVGGRGRRDTKPNDLMNEE